MKRIVVPLLMLLFSSFSYAQDEAIKASIRANIDWLFEAGGSNMPTQWHSWTYPVRIGDGSIPAWRGPTSAHNCGAAAAAYALAGVDEAALSWLCAGQSHNPHGIDQFRTYPGFTLEYLRTHYRSSGLTLIGLGPQVVAAEQIIDNVSGWMSSNHPEAEPSNHTLDPSKQEKDRPEGPGRRN